MNVLQNAIRKAVFTTPKFLFEQPNMNTLKLQNSYSEIREYSKIFLGVSFHTLSRKCWI